MVNMIDCIASECTLRDVADDIYSKMCMHQQILCKHVLNELAKPIRSEYEEKFIHNNTTNDTVCNKCGRSLDIFDKQEDFSIERHLGYGTKFDGQTLKLHVCCDCMNKLIDGCVISPVLNNHN